MKFTLKILGTASAMPISDRNPSAQALSVHGRLFLIDCGEGIQKGMRKAHLSFLKVEAIFISHIHGDHVFGVFGLLSTMAMYGRVQELHIYAPQAFGGILKFFLSYFGEGVNFEIIHHSLTMSSPETVHVSKRVSVSAFPLKHKIDCYGFRFDANDGTSSYAYCSDTMPFPELPAWLGGVGTLYHEATYEEEMADKAAMRYHSTTVQAAVCAKEAGVERLIVGHYSSRIYEFDKYLSECTAVFPNTVAARDGDSFEI